MRVEDNRFRGYADGWLLEVYDSEYPVGKVGLYNRALQDAVYFDGLHIDHLEPPDETQDWD